MVKKDLQKKLEEITGVAPDDSLTVKQLEEALKEVEAIENGEDLSLEKPIKRSRKIIGSLY